MWTPRRVLFLILGMVLFGAAFGVYARFLGWIDGLPELPEELLVRRGADEPPVDVTVTPIEARLQQAFGPGCLEATRPRQYTIKIDFPSKGLLLAAGEFGIDTGDGRVRLAPFSLATFKARPGQPPEITTIHCDVAFLEFDRPVRTVAEMNNRRIVACELQSDPQAATEDPRRGRIQVVNNRSTDTPDDDLLLETPGPVLYREAAQPNLPPDKAVPQLRTAAAVKMIDRRHQSDATTIDAQGMEVYLAVDETAPGPNHKPKSHGSAVSGVRRVVLPGNVRMNLWMDPKEGFLATGSKAKRPEVVGPVKPADPSHVLITTLGPFTYDVRPDGNRARFERLPPAVTQLPNCVRVVRPLVRAPGADLNDQLECDFLEMHFAPQRVAAASASPPARQKTPAAKDDDRQALDWVHAWGQYIVLTSDEEKLAAHGNDLSYNALTKATTLKGIPEMVAVKDGNEIHAGELTLYGAESKEGRHAEVPGGGRFRLLDRAGTKRTVEARWRDHMVYRQEEGRDLLTLSGEAVFEDRENDQILQADQLKLLLAAAPKPPTGPVPPAAGKDQAAPKLHPQRLEATGHVAAKSPDLVIYDTEQLVLLFKDLPPGIVPPPPGAGNTPWTTPVAPQPPTIAGTPAVPASQPRKKPITVTARTVQAFVNRQGEQNLLDVVHCEDQVRVHQDPVPPQVKPVDMRGRALKLRHTNDGNVLTVTGTLDTPGEVHTPDLSLIGPNIVIDQVENAAEVQGLGSMRMVSTTDFEGKKLKEPTPLTVSWKQGMKFTGQHARFHGFVQAEQQDTTLLCQTMQVYLNRPVSLSQRAADSRGPQKEAANVDKVVCEAGDRPQGVIITETVHENGRLKSTKQLEADEVAIKKDEGLMEAANYRNGRGNVRIVQLGPKGDSGVGPRPPAGAAGKPTELEYKLTWVRYNGTMKVNNQTRLADFFDGVELLHLPLPAAEQMPAFDATVNKLPAGALHLRANRMRVYSGKDAADQTRQVMEASGRARITWGDTFTGEADSIRFDEAKQQMTMSSTDGGFAIAKRFRPNASEPAVLRARKIIYNRATDQFYSDGTYSAVTGN